MSNELFKQATQNKYRFESTKGLLTVEDLWDLSLTALDNVAVTLDEQIQKAGRKSFIERRAASTTELDNKLEIVKVIIADKQAEKEASKLRAEKANHKAFLTDLLNKKKLTQLEGLSVEEIQAQLNALGQ